MKRWKDTGSVRFDSVPEGRVWIGRLAMEEQRREVRERLAGVDSGPRTVRTIRVVEDGAE